MRSSEMFAICTEHMCALRSASAPDGGCSWCCLLPCLLALTLFELNVNLPRADLKLCDFFSLDEIQMIGASFFRNSNSW